MILVFFFDTLIHQPNQTIMKFLPYLFSLTLLLVLSCETDDDDAPAVDGPVFENNVLHYDGNNSTGPLLPAGVHQAGIFFDAATLAPYAGRSITEVQFFMGPSLPAGTVVRIYEGSSGSAPGNLVYSADLSGNVVPASFNFHPVAEDIVIGNQDLWISIELIHIDTQQSIGCDAGPRKEGGDWLLLASDNTWLTYGGRTGESINWNIRIKLS